MTSHKVPSDKRDQRFVPNANRSLKKWTVTDIDSVARQRRKEARLIDVVHFEIPNQGSLPAHIIGTTANVVHYRIGKSDIVTEVAVGPDGENILKQQRMSFKYQSAYNKGFRGRYLPRYKIDLPEIRKIALREATTFLLDHPNAVRYYYLTANYFSFLSRNDRIHAAANLGADSYPFDGPLWIVSNIDIMSGNRHFSIYNAAHGGLLFSTTITLPTIQFLALGYSGSELLRILACCVKIDAIIISVPLAIAAGLVGPAGGGIPWVAMVAILLGALVTFMTLLVELDSLFDPDTKANIALHMSLLTLAKQKLDRAKKNKNESKAKEAEAEVKEQMKKIKKLIKSDPNLSDELKSDIEEVITEIESVLNSIPH